jgi:IS5 family transposase
MAMGFGVIGFEAESARCLCRRKELALKALRVETLRMLLGNPSYREFSKTVAASELVADFCGVWRVDAIRGISKSTLERASKFFTFEQARWMHQVLIEMSGKEKDRAQELGLEGPVQTDVCLVDTMCLEANIHLPADWVLLRDATRTLLKATKLIRTAGLLCRMPCEPEQLARPMNNLRIEMTHTRRKQDGSKARKRVLRKMKPLLRMIAEHTRRHRDRLESDYARTGYSRAQAAQIIVRVDRKLAQVPVVITQAHERLIGDRTVPSEQKLLSIYEPDVKMIVRGKPGKEVEFGNTLFMAESAQDLILDWELYRQKAPLEWGQLQESIERQNAFDLPVEIDADCGDRGFAAKAGKEALEASEIYDAVCPRNPAELKARLQESQFVQLQRRRGSTEARVAIFKQSCAKRLRCRGFAHRHLVVAWVVLSHNLWVVARMLIKQEKLKQAA